MNQKIASWIRALHNEVYAPRAGLLRRDNAYDFLGVGFMVAAELGQPVMLFDSERYGGFVYNRVICTKNMSPRLWDWFFGDKHTSLQRDLYCELQEAADRYQLRHRDGAAILSRYVAMPGFFSPS